MTVLAHIEVFDYPFLRRKSCRRATHGQPVSDASGQAVAAKSPGQTRGAC